MRLHAIEKPQFMKYSDIGIVNFYAKKIKALAYYSRNRLEFRIT